MKTVGAVLCSVFGVPLLLLGWFFLDLTLSLDDKSPENWIRATYSADGDSYTSRRSPFEVAGQITEEERVEARIYDPAGIFLYYTGAIVAIVPSGAGSRIHVDTPERGYARWYSVLGGRWGGRGGEPELFRGGSGEAVFTEPDLDRVVERLSAAHGVQKICYGWEIDPGTEAVPQTGSHLGTGADIRTDRRCPRWVVVKARYTRHSPGKDTIRFAVEASHPRLGIRAASLPSGEVAIMRASTERVTDRPAVTRIADAVGALPLLATVQADVPPVLAGASAEPGRAERHELMSARTEAWAWGYGFSIFMLCAGVVSVLAAFWIGVRR